MKMCTFSNLEKRVLDAIDASATDIIGLAHDVLQTPELGYFEEKTSARICSAFEGLGLAYRKGLAVTGVRADGPQKDGPRLCLIGELDAVLCPGHPDADLKTGAAHACGHHAQLAALYGAAAGLVRSGVLDELSGRVSFFAVPAEEYIDLGRRRKLKEQGIIQYYGGKQELIARGEFDDLDLAMMVHAHPNTPEPAVFAHGSSLGFFEKSITFHGKAAHASTPDLGINALNAAALAILGMHANRERFRDEDKIRVHPIITKGGDVVNSVPHEVCMETYVRGVNFDAIRSASADTDRAIHGAAAMVGAEATVQTRVGYFPLHQDPVMGQVFCEAAEHFMDSEQIHSGVDMVGSTDIGDLSHLMPCIQPTVGGFEGTLHGEDFCAANPDSAYLLPAKLMALTAVRLLENDAALARKAMAQFRPAMTKEEYLKQFD